MNRYLNSSLHIPEDRLEFYLLERLQGQRELGAADDELDSIEGHLQECPACFCRAREEHVHITLIKRALEASMRTGKQPCKAMHASHGN